MKANNVVRDKSFAFALKIVQIYRLITSERREFVLSKQLLKSATSIGANVEESVGAQSRKDFLMKLTIAYKEARETAYWIRLLRAGDYLMEDEFVGLMKDVEELCRIIGSIQISMKNRNS